MNEKLDKIIGPVFALIGFGSLLLFSIGGLIVQSIKGGSDAGSILILIMVFAFATGISLHALIKSVVLATTGTMETMKFLNNSHRDK